MKLAYEPKKKLFLTDDKGTKAYTNNWKNAVAFDYPVTGHEMLTFDEAKEAEVNIFHRETVNMTRQAGIYLKCFTY